MRYKSDANLHEAGLIRFHKIATNSRFRANWGAQTNVSWDRFTELLIPV